MKSTNIRHDNDSDSHIKMVCVQGSVTLSEAMDILSILCLDSQERVLGKEEFPLRGIKERCSPQVPCCSTATAP